MITHRVVFKTQSVIRDGAFCKNGNNRKDIRTTSVNIVPVSLFLILTLS